MSLHSQSRKIARFKSFLSFFIDTPHVLACLVRVRDGTQVYQELPTIFQVITNKEVYKKEIMTHNFCSYIKRAYINGYLCGRKIRFSDLQLFLLCIF